MKLHEIALKEQALTIEEFAHAVTRNAPNKGRTTTFTINNGKIDVDGSAHLSDWDGWNGRDGHLTEIPFPFGTVTDNFDCADIDITSLKNCPEVVGGDFYCYATNITNFEHVSKEISGFLNATNCPITSLIGVEKHFGHVHELRLSFDKIKEGGLGLLNIDGLEYINPENFKHLPIQFFYISRHLLNGKDIFACQAELIEHGFEEYAQL